MRILHAHSDLHGGGIERLMVALASEQARRGRQVGICYFAGRHGPPPAELTEALSASGIALFQRSPLHVMSPDYAWALGRVARRFRPAILHLHGGTIGCVGAAVGRLARVPAVVYTEHVMCHPATPEQGPYCHASWIRWLRSATAPLLSCTVAISTAVAKSLPRGSRLVKVIYNGVDLSAYGRLDPEQCRRGLREELALGAETVLLTTVGHLTPLKAYHVAIGALAELRQHGHDGAHLVLCGDGPERSALERQSTALGLHDVVHFLGWRNDIPRILTGSDVLVHTALEEGLGLSIIEAGAAGLPAVASRTGGIPEVTEDCVTGLLFEPGNPAALAAALTTLVSDPRRRAELGLRAQGRVRERFSLEACAGAYLRLYQSLTEGPALSAS